MAFPPIAIKTTNATVSEELQEALEQKFQSLEKYLGEETDVKCEAEFEKAAPSENGPVHRIEVNLFVAGVMHRAEATKETFIEAVDEVRDQLDKELRRRNKKYATLLKKGGRKIKNIMRFGQAG